MADKKMEARPTLTMYQKPTKLSQYPKATCFQAGHLVSMNAGWRSVRPVVQLEKCIGCLRCYQYCPDGVIYQSNQKVAIDYDFCKGCGICATQCPRKAIDMEEEHGK